MSEKNRNKGFSFIEAMIVIALFAVIGASLVSSFSLGFKVWKRSASLSLDQRKAVIELERLSTDLKRFYPYYVQGGFFGTNSSVEVVNIMRDRIFNITYAYSTDEKCVYRSAISRQEAFGWESASPRRKMVEGVQNFTLSFYGYDPGTGTFGFFDSWSSATNFGAPLAVNVSLVLQNGKEFGKVITIPITQ